MAQAGTSNVVASGNLALAYQETLTSIVRLRSARQTVSDAQYFREQFVEALKVSQEEARSRGYSDEEIREARFAVVAFLDETVLNLRSAAFADWVRKPLQEELFGVHVGGEVFFQNLERLTREPDSQHLADVLEVYLLCLTLGYAGKYSISGRGEVMGLKQSLISRIRRIRGPESEISPSWRPVAITNFSTGRDPWLRPLLYAAISCLVLALILFASYKFSLQSAASSVSAAETTGANR
ncbi:MAG: type IVB secretion system protein IcmH/DotU [Acidobacteriota bacterium]|nr:type IVB secretion system protein IcmH/DotU [Acidobacteriota bacterium]